MSNINKLAEAKVLRELSDNEQQSLTGGVSSESFGIQDFFFQKTDIRTFGSSEFGISNTNGDSAFSSQKTGYSLSQITISIGSFFSSASGGRRRRRNSASSNGFLSFLLALI